MQFQQHRYMNESMRFKYKCIRCGLHIAVVEKNMAQSLHIGFYGPFTNLPSGICAMYFDYKIYKVSISSRKSFQLGKQGSR